MTWVLGGGALLCGLYYIIIMAYTGGGTSAAGIWLLGALFFGLCDLGFHYGRRHAGRLPMWLPVSAATLCATGVLIFVIVEILVFTGLAGSTPQGLDYVIVLGARVREDGISNSLKIRLDKAIEYIEQNPDTVLVLSGGQGPDEPESEARAMYDYLLYNGVEPEQMLLEERSSSTVENMAYSKIVIEEDIAEKRAEAGRHAVSGPIAPGPYLTAQDKPVQIGVLTSDFHVYRAKQIGEKRGIHGIYGIASGSDPILFPHLCVRECLAILKDKLMGNI